MARINRFISQTDRDTRVMRTKRGIPTDWNNVIEQFLVDSWCICDCNNCNVENSAQRVVLIFLILLSSSFLSDKVPAKAALTDTPLWYSGVVRGEIDEMTTTTDDDGGGGGGGDGNDDDDNDDDDDDDDAAAIHMKGNF